MPKRIQMTRQRPWRADNPRAVIVARPTKWGNPFPISDVARRFPSLSTEQCAGFVVNEFRHDLRSEHPEYPNSNEIRAELAGRDLACWCPLDQPCHADVLLELANGDES